MLKTRFAVFSVEPGDHLERYSLFEFNHFTNRILQIHPLSILQLESTELDIEPVPIKIELSSETVSTYYWKPGFNVIYDNQIIPVYDFINKGQIIPDGGRVSCYGDYPAWCNLRMREQIQYYRLVLSMIGCPEPVTRTFVAKEKGIPLFVAAALKKAGTDAGAECVISMNPLKECSRVAVTDCYHCFDADSLSTWCRTKNTCPLCKVDIGSIVYV
jgi:hypothetical protein